MKELNYDAFPELAATILDWWETLALTVLIGGLFINFFFTMHKGTRYRAAFVLLLVTLLTFLYVDVITPAPVKLMGDDMLRPIMYSAWAYTAWTRAWLYMEYFIELRGQYDNTIERVLSMENTVVPWKDVAMFSAQMEHWQKWVWITIASIFAIGQLYSNVDRIEALQVVSIRSNQIAAQKEQESKETTLAIKRQQDSLLLQGVIRERKLYELQLVKLNEILRNSTDNKELLVREQRQRKQQLDALRSLERQLKAQLVPVPTLRPQGPTNFKLPTDLPGRTTTRRVSFDEQIEEYGADTLFAKYYEQIQEK